MKRLVRGAPTWSALALSSIIWETYMVLVHLTTSSTMNPWITLADSEVSATLRLETSDISV